MMGVSYLDWSMFKMTFFVLIDFVGIEFFMIIFMDMGDRYLFSLLPKRA